MFAFLMKHSGSAQAKASDVTDFWEFSTRIHSLLLQHRSTTRHPLLSVQMHFNWFLVNNATQLHDNGSHIVCHGRSGKEVSLHDKVLSFLHSMTLQNILHTTISFLDLQCSYTTAWITFLAALSPNCPIPGISQHGSPHLLNFSPPSPSLST